MTARIGLLGGTFDPPHVGHLWLAETATDQLKLDAVWFLPVGRPPHKEEAEITAVSHRIAMLQTAVSPAPYFRLDTIDADRPPPHTTVSLLQIMRQRHKETAFWLIIGGDSLRDFPTWVDPQGILTQCRLAVLPRPGAEIDRDALETAVPGLHAAVDWLDGPTLPISGTEIRRWARAGHSLRFLLPPGVYHYVRENDLYRNQ